MEGNIINRGPYSRSRSAPAMARTKQTAVISKGQRKGIRKSTFVHPHAGGKKPRLQNPCEQSVIEKSPGGEAAGAKTIARKPASEPVGKQTAGGVAENHSGVIPCAHLEAVGKTELLHRNSNGEQDCYQKALGWQNYVASHL